MSARSLLAGLVVAAAALTCGAPVADAATTDALQPLANAVVLRHESTDVATARGRRVRSVLERIADRLATQTDSLATDMAIARLVGRTLRRSFPRDPEFAPLFASGAADLVAAADAERARLGAWGGRLGDETREAALADAMEALAKTFRRAGRVHGVLTRLATLRHACIRIDATRLSLQLEGDPPLAQPPMPDFSLADVNAASPTFGQNVSPRDLLGKVGAWYFGHAT